ncbi:MAG: carboxypeptidase regulatory-like domain-containing protein [Acidobacteriaceae bacterium]|nr:carboxypeptidase regulatory-like domain-containing protein [Acidobacteriaceae bacterium]
MIRRVIAALSCILISLPCVAQQPPSFPAHYLISGVVVRHGTNQPLKRARVTIMRNDHPDQQASLVTAEDGRFRFTDVPQGKFTLAVEYRGVQRTFEEDNFYSTGIVTGPTLDSEHIVFQFPVPTSIVVKVLDGENEPVQNAQVWLFRRRIASGWALVELASQNSSDSEGLCRLAHLEPGTYYVAASGRPWYAQNRGMNQGAGLQSTGASELDLAYPIVYYANTQNPDAATPVNLSEGDAAQLQITLRAVQATHISIEGIPGNPNSTRGGQVMTLVEAVGPGGIRFQTNGSFYVSEAEGEREIEGLAPGNYLVSLARFGAGRGDTEPLGALKINATGDTKIAASEVASTTNISGHLVLEDGEHTGPLRVWLGQPADGQNAFCPVQSDGSFRCRSGGVATGNIAPGAYEVRLMNTSEFYVKSVDVKGASYSSGMLEVREGATVNLSVLAARGLTKVNGIALKDGRPLSGAMILLVPSDSGHGTDIPRDQSDSDGTFTLFDVKPGRYSLVAIDHGQDLEYHNPGVLQPYLSQAQTIEIPQSQSDPVRVNVQARR